jgi:hypothetical protein
VKLVFVDDWPSVQIVSLFGTGSRANCFGSVLTKTNYILQNKVSRFHNGIRRLQ